jgi:hypothetical protein
VRYHSIVIQRWSVARVFRAPSVAEPDPELQGHLGGLDWPRRHSANAKWAGRQVVLSADADAELEAG